jgi:hypothetical protein
MSFLAFVSTWAWRWRRSVFSRQTEDRLGIGHGTLQRLLDGQMELKMRHLLDVCR